jgi:predicted component of type VI protein secretion system
MTTDEYDSLLSAISGVEQQLSTGLHSVTTSIARLTEMHHQAILEQERRNSSFATLERLDGVVRRLDDLVAGFAARNERLEAMDRQIRRQDTQISQLSDTFSTRSVNLLTSTTGWLVVALITVGSNILTYILAHAH